MNVKTIVLLSLAGATLIGFACTGGETSEGVYASATGGPGGRSYPGFGTGVIGSKTGAPTSSTASSTSTTTSVVTSTASSSGSGGSFVNSVGSGFGTTSTGFTAGTGFTATTSSITASSSG